MDISLSAQTFSGKVKMIHNSSQTLSNKSKRSAAGNNATFASGENYPTPATAFAATPSNHKQIIATIRSTCINLHSTEGRAIFIPFFGLY